MRLDPVEIRKAPGQSYARVDLRVPDTRLRGLVVDEEEQAVPKAELFFLVPRKRPSRAATDDEGIAHGGSFVPFMTAFRWAAFQRAVQTDPRRLVVPNMDAGDYMICVGPESYVAIPKGLTPPEPQCSRGTLAPLQELVLTVLSPSAVPPPAPTDRGAGAATRVRWRGAPPDR